MGYKVYMNGQFHLRSFDSDFRVLFTMLCRPLRTHFKTSLRKADNILTAARSWGKFWMVPGGKSKGSMGLAGLVSQDLFGGI